ncbi:MULTISPECIES: electron transfer flavoprotein subunit beta/FixA family protein [Clostridium]|uniref:Electron transfer flavoprotein small subunit n=1 Tax=Clostridium ragsdalei P11 TaxID=1353534 RepID=A0A1A6APY8_9CLOT|nr:MULTISPECIES: electron transfer flavoprotein subunit beta/FixA family protein [Clostridium]OBR92115.1 acryloyl-CoA reductase electron transfer subunit gamma [Clostridium ragsdalei P11]QXE21124.1 electron transfer flavoprotein, beta subunit [Clostridium sp. 001]
MNIVVLIKQVPDMEKVKFDREKGVVDRKSAGVEINPFDLNALEAAVQISEKIDAKVTVVSMGPPSADQALRECIARGANEGILISDVKFGGSDTKATSSILASAIKKIGSCDLVIAGEKTVDGDTGQVGPEVAEFLDVPHASYVSKITDASDDKIEVCSEIWEGTYLKSVKLPALITVTKDINEPRLPSFKNKMKARKAEIQTLKFEDLKEYTDADKVGFKGSPTKVKKIEVPKIQKRQGKIYREADAAKAEDELVDIFRKKKILEA